MDKIKKGLGRGLSSLIGEQKIEVNKNQLFKKSSEKGEFYFFKKAKSKIKTIDFSLLKIFN